MTTLDMQLLLERRARYERLRARADSNSRYYNDLAETAALMGDSDQAEKLDSKEFAYYKESAFYDSIIDAIDIIVESLKQGYKGVAQYNAIMRDFNEQFDLVVTVGV